MKVSCDLIVFTDLDGTLIDHHTYDYAPASPALNSIKNLSVGLVLASSKTAPEVSKLRSEIGVEKWPAIVENGAGILAPFDTGCHDDSSYQTVRAALEQVPDDLRRLFCGFGDMFVDQVMRITGLSQTDAELAQSRSFSEPGIWSGASAQKDIFLDILKDHGVRAQQGGRFLTLSLGANKVDQMRDIITAYAPLNTIALGDAPNDIAMLEAADIGIVVANPSGPSLPTLRGEKEGRIIRTKDAGPVGWNTAVLDALMHLNLK